MSGHRSRRRKPGPAKGVKALISMSALAGTLIGWGWFGRQGLQNSTPPQPVDVRGIVEQILGELPRLLTNSGSARRRSSLRSVNVSGRGSSSLFPITRTQSSR
ncbi:MAG: hypothetical protein P8X64_08145 [Anaerolineales bacterium]|jgi:hypothetical protein